MATNFKPTNYTLLECFMEGPKGQKQDLAGLFLTVDIFEDILSSTLSAQIVIQDSINLIRNFPIIGQETVTISFQTHDTFRIIKCKFNVFNVSEQLELNSNSSVAYQLNLVSRERMIDQTKFVKRSLKGKNCQLVSSILSNELQSQKKNNIEECQTEIDYVPCMQRPIETIFLITARSKSKKLSSPSYVFYEDVEKFNFVSLEQLVLQPPLAKYEFSQSQNLQITEEQTFYNVSAISKVKQSSPSESIMNGTVGSTFAIFDPITRTVKLQERSLKDKSHANTSKLGKNSKETKILQDDFEFHSTEGVFKLVPAGSKSEVVQQRQNLLNQYTNTIVNRITVPGNSNLSVGKVLEITMPNGYAESTETTDQELSGKYLIVAVRHTITAQSYNTVLEISKDQFNQSPVAQLKQKNKKLDQGIL